MNLIEYRKKKEEYLRIRQEALFQIRYMLKFLVEDTWPKYSNEHPNMTKEEVATAWDEHIKAIVEHVNKIDKYFKGIKWETDTEYITFTEVFEPNIFTHPKSLANIKIDTEINIPGFDN